MEFLQIVIVGELVAVIILLWGIFKALTKDENNKT